MGKRAFSAARLVVSLALVSVLATWTSAEVFTSLEDMNMLVANGIEITGRLKEFLDTEYRKLDRIKS